MLVKFDHFPGYLSCHHLEIHETFPLQLVRHEIPKSNPASSASPQPPLHVRLAPAPAVVAARQNGGAWVSWRCLDASRCKRLELGISNWNWRRMKTTMTKLNLEDISILGWSISGFQRNKCKPATQPQSCRKFTFWHTNQPKQECLTPMFHCSASTHTSPTTKFCQSNPQLNLFPSLGHGSLLCQKSGHVKKTLSSLSSFALELELYPLGFLDLSVFCCGISPHTSWWKAIQHERYASPVPAPSTSASWFSKECFGGKLLKPFGARLLNTLPGMTSHWDQFWGRWNSYN